VSSIVPHVRIKSGVHLLSWRSLCFMAMATLNRNGAIFRVGEAGAQEGRDGAR
jgi:hypothetical protein